MSAFPERLRAARLELDITQEELGFRVGVSKASVSAWETGRESPSFRLLPALRDALGRSLDSLICGGTDNVRDAPGSRYPALAARDAAERKLLQHYRALPAKKRSALLDFVREG